MRPRNRFTWGARGGVVRENADGTNTTPIVTTSGALQSIALDVAGNSLYWTETDPNNNNGSISRADLDGSNVTLLVTGLVRTYAESSTVSPLGLAVDPAGGKLYWDDDTGVSRANLDGTGEEQLVSN